MGILSNLNRSKRAKEPEEKTLSAVDILVSTPGMWNMTNDERMQMTISCRDTDYIPKVRDAGTLKTTKGEELQIMFNGLKVVGSGYHGAWMSTIITSLKGHHEPQEEKVFYEVMKRVRPGSVMIELGCFWAYYSVWFNKQIKNATTIACEPDPNNIKIGQRNAELNNADVTFLVGAAGSKHNTQTEVVMDSDQSRSVSVPILSVDGLVKDRGLERLDLLHMDVQGFELDALEGAIETIKSGKLRFLFVSTHHYCLSGDPDSHGKCRRFIESKGGHIITSHSVLESFSGDGLIVASFSDEDKDFTVPTSVNHSDSSLFRSHEADLAILVKAYDDKAKN